MRARTRRIAIVAPLVVIVIVGAVLAIVLSLRDDDGRPPLVADRTYDFDSATLQNGFGAYNSVAETGIESVTPQLVSQRNGVLTLRAQGRRGSGVCLCTKADKPTKPYGRWVVRARASAGDRDHGFAILLWPNAEDWPVGGEIDLLELPDADRSRLQTSVHYGKQNNQFTRFTRGDFTRWHEYGVTWTPKYISFDVDGHTVFVVRSPEAIPHRPMHLAMQAGRNPSVKNPGDQVSTLSIDRVRTYAYLGR